MPLEAIFTTLVVDSYESRDVATFNVPGDYLRKEIPGDKIFIIKIQGKLVNIICDINLDHKLTVRYKYGGEVLYLLLSQNVCGCIKSVLLWYKLCIKTLQKIGSIISILMTVVISCVVNKMIKGWKCTIIWYIDYNKASHFNIKVIDELLGDTKKHIDYLVVTRVGKNYFKGMTI